MPSIATSHPDPPPIPPKQKRIRNEEHRQTPQQCTRPPDPKIMKHSRREQREASSKQRAQKVIPGQHRRRVSGICVSEVTEYGVEDQTRAHAEEARADDGDDPVYAFEVACPTKPEEGDGEGESPHA